MPTKTNNNNIKLPDEHPKLTSYKALKSYLLLLGSESTTDEELQQLYDNSFVNIELNGYSVSIPFDAVIYNSLLTLIDTQIEEF